MEEYAEYLPKTLVTYAQERIFKSHTEHLVYYIALYLKLKLISEVVLATTLSPLLYGIAGLILIWVSFGSKRHLCMPTILFKLSCISLYVCITLSATRPPSDQMSRVVMLLLLHNQTQQRICFMADFFRLIYDVYFGTTTQSFLYSFESAIGTWLFVLAFRGWKAAHPWPDPINTELREREKQMAQDLVDDSLNPLVYYRGSAEEVEVTPAAKLLLSECKANSFAYFAAHTTILSQQLELGAYLAELRAHQLLTADECCLTEDAVYIPEASTEGASIINPNQSQSGSPMASPRASVGEMRLRITITRDRKGKDMILLLTKQQRKHDEQRLQRTGGRLGVAVIKALVQEIKRPADNIITNSQRLQELTDERGEHQRCLAIIKNCSYRLQMLTDEMFDYANVIEETCELHKEPFDVRPFVAEVARTVIKLSENTEVTSRFYHPLNVEIDETVPTEAIADSKRLMRVMLHLIFHLKQYGSHSTLCLSLNYNYSEQELVFQVKDVGLGLDERRMQGLERLIHGDLDNGNMLRSGSDLEALGRSLYRTAVVCEQIASPLRVFSASPHGIALSFYLKQPLKGCSARIFRCTKAADPSTFLNRRPEPKAKSSFKHLSEGPGNLTARSEPCEDMQLSNHQQDVDSGADNAEVAEENAKPNAACFAPSLRPETMHEGAGKKLWTAQIRSASVADIPTSPLPSTNSSSRPKLTFLVVDQNAESRVATKELLRSLNLSADEAETWEDACAHAWPRRYAAVILSASATQKQKFYSPLDRNRQLSKEKRISPLTQLPVIFITPSSETHPLLSESPARPTEVITQPLSILALRNAITRTLGYEITQT